MADDKVMVGRHCGITINGKTVNVYNALSRTKFVPKTRVRGSMRLGVHYVVSKEIWQAIKAYEVNGGFADMKLALYLDRLFEKKDLSSDQPKIS